MDIIKLEQLKEKVNEYKVLIKKLKVCVNLSLIEKQIEKYEKKISEKDFWKDVKYAQKITKKSSLCKNKLKKIHDLDSAIEDCETMIKMIEEDDEDSLILELEETLKFVKKEIEIQTLSNLLNGEYDHKNVILTLHAGAGGTESMDWVQMMYRMYTRFAERHNFKVRVLNLLDGEEAGIKSISILISGENAYGYLKSEMGVHRLVRVSPFDSSGRRHTSFASVEVLPEIDEDLDVKISEDDIKVDVFRASGAGGQHVNKTSSAVRITHIPTGIIVSCQNERSQLQNKNTALKILKSKLIEIKERQHLEKIEDIKGDQKDIAWGSQVRSYIFMPYTLVKDHRTKFENGNIDSVMDGDLDGFINAYLSKEAKEKIKE